MADKRQVARLPEAESLDDPLTELGRALVAQIGHDEPGVAGGAAPFFGEDSRLSLDLRDLIRDDNGEVVLYNDSGLRAIGLNTDAHVVARGHAEAHVTASGEDVSGFQYLTFDDGLTLYYQEGLDVQVQAAGA
jgi:hypothetical protein